MPGALDTQQDARQAGPSAGADAPERTVSTQKKQPDMQPVATRRQEGGQVVLGGAGWSLAGLPGGL